MDPSKAVRGRQRRLEGWGFVGESYPPSHQLLAWLEHRIGRPQRPPGSDVRETKVPDPEPLPELPVSASADPIDRLAHARGRGLTDLLRLRTQTVPAVPEAVLRPGDEAEVESVLSICSAQGVVVVPFGGGTSVTGGLNLPPDGPPTVSLDLERFTGLGALDQRSRLATFGAGTLGPEVEAALERHGFTLGHYPQSFELSTMGGWVVTRASGQQSLGYGGIKDMLAGLELVAPAGRLSVPALPASASGPDLRQIVLGSEGRMGVVTQATVRVQPKPQAIRVEATLMPSFSRGLDAARALTQSEVPLSLMRLSDESETEVAMTVGLSSHSLAAPLIRRWLRLRGIQESGSLMLYGADGEESEVRDAIGETQSVLRRFGGVGLGARPGKHWLGDCFRHPYLRDALLDLGIATDTLETAASWSRLETVSRAVREALQNGLTDEGEQTAVLCHLSHPYRDGSSLYFTFFFRCPTDPEEAIARWAKLKRAATKAIADYGGAISHHHGVGSWHTPWLDQEIGPLGRAIVGSCARTMDPAAILNPHVLLDPADRLLV